MMKDMYIMSPMLKCFFNISTQSFSSFYFHLN